MRRILVVNDDGIGFQGIAVLARLAQHFGEVSVVAPAGQNSAMAHHIVIHRDFHVREYAFPVPGVRAYSLDKISDYSVVERYFDEVTEKLLRAPIEKNAIWNVNFPGCAVDQVQGIRDDVFAEPSEEKKPVGYQFTDEPDGSRKLAITEFYSAAWKEGSDLWALDHGFISVQKIRNTVL